MSLSRYAPGLCLLAPYGAQAAAGEPLGSGQALQVMFGLAVVLGLIIAVSWLGRRMQLWKPHGQGRIKILEGMAVGARDKLLLVEVDNQRLLIGVSPGRMAALSAWSSADAQSGFAETSFDDALAASQATVHTSPHDAPAQ